LNRVSKGLQAPVKNAARDAKNKLAVANKALGALTTPQTKVTEALQSRESLVAESESALHSVRIQAAAAWETKPAKLKALLAPAPAPQRSTKKRVTTRKAKPSKKPVPATPPVATRSNPLATFRPIRASLPAFVHAGGCRVFS